MDDFVRNKLTEWNLSDWIETFKDQCIDKESLYCLGDQEIAELIPTVGPRSKFKKRLKLLKEEQNTTNLETVESSAQVCPSTSNTSNEGKRKMDLQGEPRQCQPPTQQPRDDIQEEIILSDVKNIMRCVKQKLPNEDNKLNKFLKDKIKDLETDKREVVGVFGKTGAGKSSLINAVIGEKNLLPSGDISACTTVMTKVEANMQNSKYEAHIDFITKEDWRDELWYFLQHKTDQENDQEEDQENDQEEDQEDDDDYQDTEEKLSALYGEGWKNKSSEELMDFKHFKEIPEFLQSKKKILTCESAEKLSTELVKYTRSDSEDGDAKDVKRWYWPLVKCVTVKVPNNKLLQHVTLVDLPGNGDRNKSRDQMWKRVVESCSTVWIVTDCNRAASEKEPWDILKDASSHMGNGGECQNIHFICTKSDLIKGSDDLSADGVRAFTDKKTQVKKKVKEEFIKLHKVKKHFSDECFKVFTVSSKEFLEKKRLEQDDTEIPKLQEFLKGLNDRHSETLNYVSRARGILSLMHGASRREGADIKTAVCKDLEEKLKQELEKVRKPIEETFQAFEKCLSEGVEKSKSSCEKVLKSVIHPAKKSRGFHSTLKRIVENNGIHKTKKGKQINLNMKLTSCLTDSIDEKFKETFPNEGKCGPFKGVINKFSLGIKRMREKREYKDVILQLIFLRTEEEKMKTKLNEIIREDKKIIYRSLTTTIENTMEVCYEKAKKFSGVGSQKNMRDTIVKHVQDSKNIMFELAKDVMLNQLRDLKFKILETLKKTMMESIELSLKTERVSIPDVTEELDEVKNYYNELMRSPDTESLLWPDSPGQAAALRP